MLNCDHLYYLLQVAKYGSITTAAEKLHVSQPTVSLAIKKLEEQLDMQLLNRSFKGAHLTDEGQKVVRLSKIVFENLEKIEEMASERHDQVMKEVIIYSIPALYSLLSEVASAYYKKYPLGNFHLLKLEDTALDALFAQQPEALVVTICQVDSVFAPELDYLVLESSKSYISLRLDSDLLPQEQTSISCKEVLNLPLIMVDTGNKLSQSFAYGLYEHLKTYGQPHVKFNVPDMSIANNYLRHDMGVCFYCDFPLMKTAGFDGVVTRKILIKNAPQFNIILLYKKDHEPAHIRGVSELIDSIR